MESVEDRITELVDKILKAGAEDGNLNVQRVNDLKFIVTDLSVSEYKRMSTARDIVEEMLKDTEPVKNGQFYLRYYLSRICIILQHTQGGEREMKESLSNGGARCCYCSDFDLNDLSSNPEKYRM